MVNRALDEKNAARHVEEGDLEQRDAATSTPTNMIVLHEEKSSNRRLNRRLDLFLLPLLSLLYLFNGLDRSNVGNAETQGTINKNHGEIMSQGTDCTS